MQLKTDDACQSHIDGNHRLKGYYKFEDFKESQETTKLEKLQAHIRSFQV